MSISRKGLSVVWMILLLTGIGGFAGAAEQKRSIEGHVYCVLPTADGVKLEPGVCPGGDHPHILKTKDGKLVLLQESPVLKDIPKLSADEKKDVKLEGQFVGPTTFNPESVRWPWLAK